MDRSIRKMDAEEREAIAYQNLYEEIEERDRRIYKFQFGPEYRASHPFKPNGNAIHAEVLKRLKNTTHN